MTDRDQATQHDPAADRLAHIESSVGDMVRTGVVADLLDLSAFSRAVLALCHEPFVLPEDIRDAAARHLGGGNG